MTLLESDEGETMIYPWTKRAEEVSEKIRQVFAEKNAEHEIEALAGYA